MRQSVTVTFPVSEWVESVSHNYRGVLTVNLKDGGVYKFRAPAETIRQAQRIASAQDRGVRKSAGKWLNTVVLNGGYERLN